MSELIALVVRGLSGPDPRMEAVAVDWPLEILPVAVVADVGSGLVFSS
jgi:hypothetical protein